MQSDKEKAKLIAELRCDVGEIKQERVVVDVATFNKSLEDKKTDEFLVSVSKKKKIPMIPWELKTIQAVRNHKEKRYQRYHLRYYPKKQKFPTII